MRVNIDRDLRLKGYPGSGPHIKLAGDGVDRGVQRTDTQGRSYGMVPDKIMDYDYLPKAPLPRSPT